MELEVLDIGFTGTQEGMTEKQAEAVEDLLIEIPKEFDFEGILRFHHGCCVGSDEESALIARRLGYELYGHPPKNTYKMSSIQNDFNFEPAPFLERNHNIVKVVKKLIATPKTTHEVLRSGTWSTIRYARTLELPHVIVRP